MSLNQSNSLLDDAWKCYRAAIEAVDPKKALYKTIKNSRNEIHFSNGNISVIAVGKGSIPMAQAFLSSVTVPISHCLVVHPFQMAWQDAPSFVELLPAEHPLPGNGSLTAGRRVIATVENLSADDVLVLLISGGASSLVCVPYEGILFEDKLATVNLLLKYGVDIQVLNCVRKHLSAIKGGRLIQRTASKIVLAFLISDVIGDDISVIGSGISAPDPSTYQQAYDICVKVGTPKRVLRFFEKGMSGIYSETPKPGDTIFKKVRNFIIASNKVALKSAIIKASSLGYRSTILTDSLRGEAKTAGAKLAAILKAMKRGTFIDVGGETVVNVTGKGKGGRCQELALSAAIELDKTDNVLLWATGSDGIDGTSDSAGAWADGHSIKKASLLGVDPYTCLKENNSNFFFEKIGSLIKTGLTGTNVMDLIFLLKR